MTTNYEGNLEWYKDNVGDNISDMNSFFNELTVFYWVWKNYPMKEYVGMCSYRRYFNFFDNIENYYEIENLSGIIFEYDDKFNYIGHLGETYSNVSYTFKTGLKTRYIKFRCYKAGNYKGNPIQIEEGSTATSYEPFIDKYKVDVKVTGKNLFDINAIKDHSATCVISGNKVTVTGDSAQTYKSVRAIIPVKKNTNYALSYTSEIIKGMAYVDIFDTNFEYFSPSGIFNSGNNDFVYVKFYCNTADDVKGEVIYSNIQLEEGTTVTSYEPYFESTKTFYLNSPLLEGDKIVTKNGKVYHYHKMGKVVLDGGEDENWTDATSDATNGYRHVSTILNGKSLQGGEVYCDNIKITKTVLPGDSTNNYYVPNLLSMNTYKDYIYVTTTRDLSNFKQWLSENPTTVVYELASPYYELIDEYNNTILNIPNTVAHLTHTSTVPVNNTVFTNYKDELNVLEANTQYRVMFDCDKANVPFTVTLGGTSQEATSKSGTHSLLITTPTELVDKNLVIDGIGRCGIDNIRIFKGNVEYDYVKGLWSGYEERKLENLFPMDGYWNGVSADKRNCAYMKLLNTLNVKPNTKYTVVLYNTPSNLEGHWMHTLSKRNAAAPGNCSTFVTIDNLNEATSFLHVYGNNLVQEEIEKAIKQYPNNIIQFFTLPASYVTTHMKSWPFQWNQCTYYPKGIAGIVAEEMKRVRNCFPPDQLLYSQVESMALLNLKIPFIVYRPCLVQHNDFSSILQPTPTARRDTLWFLDYINELGVSYEEAYTPENVMMLQKIREEHVKKLTEESMQK